MTQKMISLLVMRNVVEPGFGHVDRHVNWKVLELAIVKYPVP